MALGVLAALELYQGCDCPWMEANDTSRQYSASMTALSTGFGSPVVRMLPLVS